jgi:cytochrome c biogenesis protein CcmG/thiol:disulfide interchange protein DsbE
VLLLGGLLAGCSRSARNEISATSSMKADNARKPAPEFALKDGDGKPVRLSDYKGKVVLLDFWATWCGPCRIEIPWFTELERQKKDKGFAVLGVSMDDDGWKAIKPFVAEMKINYRVLLGDDQIAKDYGGLDALPTTFLIDRNGKIADVHVGLASRKDFEAGIDELLRASGVSSGHVSLPSLLLNVR